MAKVIAMDPMDAANVDANPLDEEEDVTATAPQARGAQKEIYDDVSLLRRVRERYLAMMAEVDGVLIDGEAELDIVTDRLWAHVTRAVGLG